MATVNAVPADDDGVPSPNNANARGRRGGGRHHRGRGQCRSRPSSHRYLRVAQTTLLLSLLPTLVVVLLLLPASVVLASGDFDETYTVSPEHNATTTTAPTAPTPAPTSASLSPTLPPHKLHDHCPLRPPHSPPEITRSTRPPLVIGHRGASYNVPEHTLAGYRLALELGADFIEPDLVPTKDGILVAIHSVDLNLTTNVESVFGPSRRRNVNANETKESGYYVQDFTLAEIKKLRVRQRVEDTPARSRHFDYLFPIPTLKEIIQLLHDWNTEVRPYVGTQQQKLGGRPGLYVELKRPAYLLEDVNLNVADLFLDALREDIELTRPMFFDLNECAHLKADEYQVPPLVIQCFDGDTLQYIQKQIKSDPTLGVNSFIPPTVLLVGSKECADPDMWFAVTKMDVSGIGPDKRCLLEKTGEGLGLDFVRTAKEHGLAVHAWTERLEVEFVDTDRFGTAEEELRYMFCELEIDGVFAENVDVAVRVGRVGCEATEEEGGDGNEGGGGGGGSTEKTGSKQGGNNAEDAYEGSSGSGGEPSSSNYKGLGVCFESPREELIVVGLGFMAFGLFVGSFFTYWLTINCGRRRVRRGRTARQVQVPTAEELDMI